MTVEFHETTRPTSFTWQLRTSRVRCTHSGIKKKLIHWPAYASRRRVGQCARERTETSSEKREGLFENYGPVWLTISQKRDVTSTRGKGRGQDFRLQTVNLWFAKIASRTRTDLFAREKTCILIIFFFFFLLWVSWVVLPAVCDWYGVALFLILGVLCSEVFSIVYVNFILYIIRK